MKKLDKAISKNGFLFKQVDRYDCPRSNRSVAMYSMHTKDQQSRLLAYEVFIVPVRKNPVITPSGIIVPPGEKYPGNEEFGTTVKASCFAGNLDDALQSARSEFQNFKQYLQNGKSRLRKTNQEQHS